ncbi:MAG: transporter substrate-binding domain-containing protein [Spirochaetales bacterium]|nr:transporter substrate-binding domain-containing protein [Spirochaetales bacterium]
MRKCVFLLIFSVCATSFCGASNVISVATPQWDGTTNSDGTGLFFDILRAVYEPVGYRLDIQFMPWKRALTLVQVAEADLIIGFYYNESDLYRFCYPKWPFKIEETVAVFKKERVKNWNGISTLHGQSVLWPRGYNYHLFLGDVVPKWSEVECSQQGLKMIEVDRALFFLDASDDLLIAFEKLGFSREIYAIEVILSENLYYAFTLSPRGQKLADLYDQRIQVLIKSGELKKIFEKNGVKYVDLAPRG